MRSKAQLESIRAENVPGEIVLNEALAEELAAQVGDQVIIRLPKSDQLPADSALGKKQDRLTSLADLKVIEIIPTENLGRFSLQPMQTSPRNAYVALAEIQSALFVGEEQKEKINAMLVGPLVPFRYDLPPRLPTTTRPKHVRPAFRDYGMDDRFDYAVFQRPAAGG
jgi:hypothetical protein